MTRQPEPPGTHTAPEAQRKLLEWLRNPTVLIVAAGIIFTAFYQSLHSSPFNTHRHPGEVLWQISVTIIPAALLYAVDDWLNPPMFPVPKALQPRTFAAKSDLLRKLMGMDQPGGGIIGSVASAGRKSLSTLSGGNLLKRDCNQPAGLGNTDYSCFQNSILQGLASLQPLPEYLDSAIIDHAEPGDNSKGSSASTLQRLIGQLKDHENNGKTLWTPATLKSLHSWEQQDAQEYFSKLLDEIEKEVVKANKGQSKAPGVESALSKDDTESHHSDDSGYQSISTSSKASSEAKGVRNPLEGMTAQRVACVSCGYSEGLSLQPFNCITLNLGVGTMQHDLFELLDSYTQLESIEQVECNKCTLLRAKKLLTMLLERGNGRPEAEIKETKSRLEAVDRALEEDDFEEKTLKEKCKISAQHRSSSTKTKQVVIARPPRSLAVHVNRSVFDLNTGNMWKNLAAVKFPRTLDLGPWCLGSADQTTPRRRMVDAEKEDLTSDEETWVADPRTSMISGDHYPSKISGPVYELRSVVTHQGQHENGHYICYRKHTSSPPEKQDFPNSELTGEDTKTLDDEKNTLVDASHGEEDSDQWWRLSDESVWDVTEENVLAQGGVFMLFYDCVDPNSVLTVSLDNAEDCLPQSTAEKGGPATSYTPNDLTNGANVKDEDAFQQSLDKRKANGASRPNSVASAMSANEQATMVSLARRDDFVLGLLSRPNSSKFV